MADEGTPVPENVPVETRIEGEPGIDVGEEAAIRLDPHWRRRRLLATTAVYLALWIGTILFIHAGQGLLAPLALLGPLYLITLVFVLRQPKRLKRARRAKTLGERLTWQAKLMTGVAVFLLLYVPFSIVSNVVIPYAAIVEYLLFTLAVLFLLRLAGRSLGVAPSLDALPPPSHRLHQQVVAPIDDAHYQKTLWMNYGFVEKGKGQRQLAKRLGGLLEANGVAPARKAEILEPLDSYRDAFHWGLTRAGRERRRSDRDQRSRVLEDVFARIRKELETLA